MIRLNAGKKIFPYFVTLLLLVIVSGVAIFLTSQTNKSSSAASDTLNVVLGQVKNGSNLDVSICLQSQGDTMTVTNVTNWLSFNNSQLTPVPGIQESGNFPITSGYAPMKFEQVLPAPIAPDTAEKWTVRVDFIQGLPGKATEKTYPELLGKVRFNIANPAQSFTPVTYFKDANQKDVATYFYNEAIDQNKPANVNVITSNFDCRDTDGDTLFDNLDSAPTNPCLPSSNNVNCNLPASSAASSVNSVVSSLASSSTAPVISSASSVTSVASSAVSSAPVSSTASVASSAASVVSSTSSTPVSSVSSAVSSIAANSSIASSAATSFANSSTNSSIIANSSKQSSIQLSSNANSSTEKIRITDPYVCLPAGKGRIDGTVSLNSVNGNVTLKLTNTTDNTVYTFSPTVNQTNGYYEQFLDHITTNAINYVKPGTYKVDYTLTLNNQSESGTYNFVAQSACSIQTSQNNIPLNGVPRSGANSLLNIILVSLAIIALVALSYAINSAQKKIKVKDTDKK